MKINTVGSSQGLEMLLLSHPNNPTIYGAWSVFPYDWVNLHGKLTEISSVTISSYGSPGTGDHKIRLPGSDEAAWGDVFEIRMDVRVLKEIIEELDVKARSLSGHKIGNQGAVSFSNELFCGTFFYRHCIVGCWMDYVSTVSPPPGLESFRSAWKDLGSIVQKPKKDKDCTRSLFSSIVTCAREALNDN